MMSVKASFFVLAGVVVSATSLANGPAGVPAIPQTAGGELGAASSHDPSIRQLRDAGARPRHGAAAASPIMTETLAVEYLGFDAYVKNGTVELRWETAAEIHNEGFNVLRGTDPSGNFEAVNRQLIPAEGGPGFGAVYEYVDKLVKARTTYYYVLEDVDTSGDATYRGAGACLYDLSHPSSGCEPLAVQVPVRTDRARAGAGSSDG